MALDSAPHPRSAPTRRFTPLRRFALPTLLILAAGLGCNTGIGKFVGRLTELANAIDNVVNDIQQQDPRFIVLPVDAQTRGAAVTISADVTVITNIQTQLVVETLPDITLLGFENLTGFDTFIRYEVDGVEQGIFVYDGETLLLEYPCLARIDLLTEDDFDPATGIFDAAYDISGTQLLRPFDFDCGEAVILSIDADGVTPSVELINLD